MPAPPASPSKEGARASVGPSSGRPSLEACPLCEGRRLHYAFSRAGYRVVRCDDCGLMLLNPQPSAAELGQIYSGKYFIDDAGHEGEGAVASMRAATARLYLQDLARYRGPHGGRLLEIGCGQGHFLVEAAAAGFEVVGVDVSQSACHVAARRLGGRGRVVCGEAASLANGLGHFDVCVLSDVIEHVREPVAFLRQVRALLGPAGALVVATPSLDSWSARLLRERWMEFKAEHLYYFDSQTIQHALFRSGFHEVILRPGAKVLTPEFVVDHFERFPVPGVTTLVRLAGRLLPPWLRRRETKIVASGLLALARARMDEPRVGLSIIVPAFNEARTLGALMDALLARRLRGIDFEVILVESSSSDGTREIAERYASDPRVTLVLEETPRGKGHAVRTGLRRAKGDFVLIQDADLEYDLEDYESLLEPLVQNRVAFVLGSRHGGRAWKMRRFAGQWHLSAFLNLGHWFFTGLVNHLFGQRLRDPFTMYKVFRRDCLYGLRFLCNRFDFDFELLVKLVRKGYRPLEIPVNYRSRSFREGKKVSVWRDPPLWLRTLVRLRFERLEPLREIERDRAGAGRVS